jgi:hypothetical protein
MVLGTPLAEWNPPNNPHLEAKFSLRAIVAQISIDIEFNDPRQTPLVMARYRESAGEVDMPPLSMEMAQLANKIGRKEKCMDSRLLATVITFLKFQ